MGKLLSHVNMSTTRSGILPNEQDIYRILIEESPMPMSLYVGREMVVKVINPMMLKTWGRDASVIGKTYYESLPELADQPYFKILDDVFTSGVAYIAAEDRVDLVVDGRLQIYYFNFTFKPLKNADGSVWGILNTATDVTELVRMREKLQQSEEFRQVALDAAELGTWNLNPIDKKIVWDERCRELFGFNAGTVIEYDDALKGVHPDDAEFVRREIELAITPNIRKDYDIKYRTVNAEGKNRWIRAKGKAFFNNAGICSHFSGTVQDITKEIHENEQQRRLLKLIDSSQDFISLSDIEGNVTFVNPAGLQMVGLDSLEEAMRPNIDYADPEELFRIRGEIRKAITEQGEWIGEVNYRNFKTGEIIPVYAITMAVYDQLTGESWGRATIAKDLRQEIEAQQMLTDQIRQYEFVTNFMPVQLWTATPEGTVDFVNQRAVEFGGEPVENATGTSWLNFVHPDDVPVTVSAWQHALAKGEPYELEFRLKDKHGVYRWHLARALPFKSNGEIIKWFGTNTDIDEQKQSQKQKDDFLAIASHELKTPVTSIKAYAQVLGAMLGKEGETKKAEMVARMDAQVNRLTNLIGDLLDVTKINSGRLQFNKTWFEIDDVIKETIEDLQHTTQKHELITDFKAGGRIYSDRDRIGQVLTNLITNAIKYSPQADKIIIGTERTDNEITICVQDFGIGIPGDKKEKVFEQFYRVSGHKQHTFPGLGLGLYISSEIVKREGGKMWVNSIENKGSTFCFSLLTDEKTDNDNDHHPDL